MEFRDIDIDTVLRAICQGAEIDFVLDPAVKGRKVTAKLRNASWEEALDVILRSQGLVAQRRGNTLLIGPADAGRGASMGVIDTAATGWGSAVDMKLLPDGKIAVQARQAGVDELLGQLGKTAKLNIVTAADVKGTITLCLQGVTPADVLEVICAHSGLTSRSLGDILYIAAGPPDVRTETFRLRHGDAKELGKILSESIEDAKVSTGLSTNMLIVTGSAHMLDLARQIVEQAEVPPVQIAIETRIIETNITSGEKLGIQWSDSVEFGVSTPQIPHSWPLTRQTESRYHPGYDPSDSRSRDGNAVPHASTDDFRFGFIDSVRLGLTLHMLEQERSARMLANPVVTTVDNKPARVNIVTKYPIAQYQVSSETGALTVSGFEYKEFGTILNVTPRVSDGHILLDVHPEVSRQDGETEFQGAVLPIIRSQEAKTQVRVRDGDTLVIAGLIREDTTAAKRGVPGLSKIPLLGGLFRSRDTGIAEQRNLLIFITPHIISEVDFVRAAELKRQRSEASVLIKDYEGSQEEP